MRYLSDAWLDAAVDVFAGAKDPLQRDANFTLQQVINATPDGDVAYAFVLSGRSIELVKGTVAHPTVSFTQDWETATGVAQGQLSAQAAFMNGKIKLGGDTSTLVNNHDLLVEVEDLLIELRAETTFDA